MRGKSNGEICEFDGGRHYLKLFTPRQSSENNHLCPELSLFDIRQMKEIYREMQSKPLPEHHDQFNLSDQMYQDLLQIFMGICDDVITYLQKTKPDFPESQRIA